jgi:ATP-dependent Clp protease adaptor protein ClpS
VAKKNYFNQIIRIVNSIFAATIIIMKKEQLQSENSSLELKTGMMELILFNDDVNSFDFVIECLIQVCGHEPEQAEQCAITAHFKGKCGIKTGSQYELAPMNNELNSRGISTLLA